MTSSHALPPMSDLDGQPAIEVNTHVPFRIGPYRVRSLIGRGGMGVVYRAEEDHLERPVALKVLPPEFNTPALRKRFEHETAVLARLSHHGIAQIFTAGVAEGTGGSQPYFVMELIDGQTLTKFTMDRHLDVRERIKLVLQVCEAVQHAHQQGIVHRDLKPGNVLVDRDGQIKILDFGVAKLVSGDTAEPVSSDTQVGQVIGTIEYMSPEQARGQPDEVDTRSDVYAVGILLYELLAGRLPFDFSGRSPSARLNMMVNEDPPMLGTIDREFKGDLETIVAKAMEKDKARRYPSVSELAADLNRFLAHEAVLARPASAWYILGKFARKHRPLVLSAVAIISVLVAAVVVSSVFWLGERKERKQREQAERQIEEQKQRRESVELSIRELLIKPVTMRVESATKQGDWRGVLTAIDEAVDFGCPDTPRLELSRIRALHFLRDPRALAALESLSARTDLTEGERAETELLFGDILLLTQEHEGIRHLKEALKGPLSPTDYLYVRGVLSDSLDDALSHLREALRLDPSHHSARAQISFLLVYSGRWEEAESILATAEALFPRDPTFLIVRVLLNTFQDHVTSEEVLKQVRELLGDQGAKDFQLMTKALRDAIQASSFESPEAAMSRFEAKIHQFKERLYRSKNRITQIVYPPVFKKNYKLLNQTQQRYQEKDFADELGVAARKWPDAILFAAWGETLMIQKCFREAAAAFEAGSTAHSLFPNSIEGNLCSHMMVLSMLRKGVDPETDNKCKAKILEDIWALAKLYRGTGANRLLGPTWTGQSKAWVMVDLACQCGDFLLARQILNEWKGVAPEDPVMYAETAQVEYSAEAYYEAIKAAKKAKTYNIKEKSEMLYNNIESILKDAPGKLRAQADVYDPKQP